jgi:hypothetical protein
MSPSAKFFIEIIHKDKDGNVKEHTIEGREDKEEEDGKGNK